MFTHLKDETVDHLSKPRTGIAARKRDTFLRDWYSWRDTASAIGAGKAVSQALRMFVGGMLQ